MSCSRFLALLFFPLLLTACYEDVNDCLDLDATNFNILADEGCSDCCTFPSLSIEVARMWGDTTFLLTDTLSDGAGNDFKLIRFRVYLTELELVGLGGVLPTPENIITVGIIEGADTVETEFNANLALVQSSSSTSTAEIGTLLVGEAALMQVQGRIGMSSDFPAIYPPSAPTTSPLSTQEGLLNFNDGNGYLTASAEYVLIVTDDTVRVDIRGDLLLDLDLPAPESPARGDDVTVEMEADYEAVFGTTDLSAEETEVAAGILAGLESWLSAVGID